jgi:hypothetical protein
MPTRDLCDTDMTEISDLCGSACSLLAVMPELSVGVPTHCEHLPRASGKACVENPTRDLGDLFWEDDFHEAGL